MDPTPLLDRVLDDEGLTAGLDEAEASSLARALADRVRAVAAAARNADDARRKTDALCRRARAIATEVRSAKPGQPGPVLRRLLAEWPDRPA